MFVFGFIVFMVEEEKEKNERIYKKIKELKNNVKNLFKEISDSDFQD